MEKLVQELDTKIIEEKLKDAFNPDTKFSDADMPRRQDNLRQR